MKSHEWEASYFLWFKCYEKCAKLQIPKPPQILCVGFIFPHFAVSWIDLNDKKIEQEVNKFWECEQNWFCYYAQG